MGLTFEKAASLMKRSLTPHRPYHAQWMLTRKCNYRCQGCEVWREQDQHELSTEEVKHGLAILKDLGVIEIVLSGGNPLLRNDIDEILSCASRLFITTVYDNGSTALRKIDCLRNADFVAISIDSLDPQRHDYLRGVDGAWQKAIESVDELHRQGIIVGVAPMISQINLHEILDFTKHFVDKGIPVWYSLYSFDSSKKSGQLFRIGKKNDEFTITDRGAMVQLCQDLKILKAHNKKVFLTEKTLKSMIQLFSNDRRTWKCRALSNFLVVDHLGRVAGCHLNDPVATIADLPGKWNSGQFDVLRKEYSRCERCTYMCYLFYSLHGTVLENVRIAREEWRNGGLLLKKQPNPQRLAE